jgi:DNA-binding SARP family transcriptional activator
MAKVPLCGAVAQGGTVLRLVLAGAAPAVCRADGSRVPLGRLDAALLAVLAIEGPSSRQRLLQLLGTDDDPEHGRNALRQRLFRLRRALGTDLVSGAQHLALATGVTPDTGLDADLDTDSAAEAGADAHGRGGELLAAYEYADFPAFESWLDEQRRVLARRQREGAMARVDACEREGRYAEGAELAERCVAADPLDEPAVQRLMRLRYLAGQRAAAVAVFERFAGALHEDGGVPARETTELLATIRDASAPVQARARVLPASVLRPPRLVGRDAELRALSSAWSGERAFWLLGEAGLGKTRLIDEFVGEGGAALVVAARPGDAGVPYASLGRTLRALLERRPALLERAERAELARVLPELQPPALAAPAIGLTAVLQRAIRSLLQGAHGEGLAALVIDDLHFADSASLEMLQTLVGDDALVALRWGFAQRPADGLPAAEALRAALEETQRIEVLALAPLDEAQMGELIAALAVPGLDAARLAPLLARHTGGNPMYALETIKHLVVSGEGGLDAKLPRPASVGQLIERRLRALTPLALQLARVAAVAGCDFTIEMAESVLDMRALALADAWRELEAAQVLRGGAFAHDLVHEATLAGVPALIAQHTHGAVAAWLEAHGGEPARVASHWLDAAQPQRALVALHAAAEAAKRAMRRKEEAEFLARAARIESEAGDHDAAFDSWRAMIEAALVVDLTTLDAAMFDRLEAQATTGRQRAAAKTLRAFWLMECGDLDPAKRLARDAIDLADAAGDEPMAAEARIHLAQMLDWNSEWDAALALLQPLLPWAVERASDNQRLEFYNRLSMLLDNTSRPREARVYHQQCIDLARRIGEWGTAVTGLANLAVSWSMSGHMQRAAGVLRDALQLAAAHDTAGGSASAVPVMMYRCLRDCGRYAEALHWLEPALTGDPGQLAALTRCHFACGWVHLGQHARAQREIDAAQKIEAPEWVRAKALQMRARLTLALGRRPGVLLDEALAIMAARPGRAGLRASIALDHALTLPAADALAAARDVVAIGARLELAGTALAGHIRAARFAVDAASASAAAMHAEAALAFGEDVSPNDLYPAERWLNAWRAFQLAGREIDAANALARGVEWVRTTSRDHVPEPFRDSFARANAVNLQLLRAAGSKGS